MYPVRRLKGEYDILVAMACCYVEITGKDGKKYTLTTDAASAYVAVEKAIEAWSKLWWWDSDVVAIVKRNDESWNVPVQKVIEKTRARFRGGI
jgi:hypothetical protein